MIEAWLIPLLALACLGFAVTCWLFWRHYRRYGRQVVALHQDVVESAEASAFGQRISRRGLPNELGELGGTINLLFDALASKDEQTRQRESLFQELANAVPDLVLVHRERIVFANSVAAEPVGLEPAQLVGRPVTDLMRPAFRAMMRNAITARLAGEGPDESIEFQLINGGERGVWVEARSSLIEYRGQQAVLTVAQDITYRREADRDGSSHRARQAPRRHC